MCIGPHEYANEANDDDVPKPAQSLGTPVPRQKIRHYHNDHICTCGSDRHDINFKIINHMQ